MQKLSLAVRIAVLMAVTIPAAHAQDRTIRKELVVEAPLEEVWKAWTTEEGAATFFGRAAHIDLTVGGLYEIFFSPDLPYGDRGAEGLKVHSIVPRKMLAFQWNAPSEYPVIRRLHTLVFIRFESVGSGKTRLRLDNIGYGEGPEWDKAYDYFVAAWDLVLGRLKRRFTDGPIDWDNPYRPTESFSIRE